MAAQWEPDPMGRAQYRYFDGINWTHAVATGGVQSTESSHLPLPPAPQAYPTFGQPVHPQYPIAPYGYQPMAPPLVESVTRGLGWGIFALGLVVVLGAVTPWLKVENITISGLGGHGFGAKDGVITLPLGLVAVGLGLSRGIATRRSGLQLTAAIIGLVIGVVVAIIGLADIGDVHTREQAVEGVLSVSVGFGLVLTLIAGIGLAAISVAAIIKRN